MQTLWDREESSFSLVDATCGEKYHTKTER